MIAITQGDCAGIGPEIIARLFVEEPQLMRDTACCVVGDYAVMERALSVIQRNHRDKTGDGNAARITVRLIDPAMPPEAANPVFSNTTPEDRCIPLIQMPTRFSPNNVPPWGRISADAAQLAIDAVEWASRAALGKIPNCRLPVQAVVTAPWNKAAIARASSTALAGIPILGHTEFLQAICSQELGQEFPVRMLLSNGGDLNVVLNSIHIPLVQAVQELNTNQIMETIRMASDFFARLKTTPQASPSLRIAVAGLNPHAGENGLMGREELDIVAPAIAACTPAFSARGIQLSGPHPPDTVFMQARNKVFDVVIALYHDQGLIPLKYLGLEHGVNITLGLPLIRSSPDHGTAFDIAGTGQASAASLRAAILWAVRAVRSHQ